jgi:hypothetical protein
MKYLFTTIFIVSFLVSCQHQNDKGKIYSLETIQTNALEQFSYGEERIMEIEEMLKEREGSKEFYTIKKQIHNSLLKIDSLSGITISEFGKMKMGMFKSFGENLAIKNEKSIISYDYQKEKASRPISYFFSKVKYVGESQLFNETNRELIIKLIKKYRFEICEEIIESNKLVERNSKPYFFVDPQINEFKDEIDFTKQFERKIKKSSISFDDIQTIQRIYRILSKSDSEWKMILNEGDSWIDDLGVLLSIENDILKIRSMALTLIRIRIGCGGNYSFTHILPIINGPSAAISGDTVELQVLMAVHDAYKNPTFEILNGGKLEKVEKGIGYVKAVIPKSKNIEIKGTITIKNRSGIPHTENWNHKIRILSKKQ